MGSDKLKLNLERFCYRGLLSIFILFYILNGAACSAYPFIDTKSILGGQGSTARLDFWPPLGTDASLIDCSWSRNGNLISIDGNKYVRLGPRSLQISDIVGADEGTYSCNYNYLQRQNSNDVTVIYVIGVADFAQKQDGAHVISAHAGGSVQFDTRVAFTGWGQQMRKQKVNLLQFYKGTTQVYRCRNWSGYETSLCNSEGRFIVQMQGTEKFDFFLMLDNVQPEDGGTYEAKLEVIHPVTGSYSILKKTFTLKITEAPLSPEIIIESTGVPNKGEIYSLLCNVTSLGDSSSTDLTISLQNPSGNVIESITNSTSLEKVFSSLSLDDQGLYTCLLSFKLQGSEQLQFINESIEIIVNDLSVEDTHSFQLCIGPFFLKDCSALAVDSQKGTQLENEIRSEITRNVLKRCPGCSVGLSESLVQPGTLRCSENAARLIYRSTINESSCTAHNASEIIDIIEEWVTSTVPGQATLHLWPFVMDLDSRCPVTIASQDSPYPSLATTDVNQFQLKENIESCLLKDFGS